MRPRLFLRYLVWESRGSFSRLSYFVACLAVGVAAVVAVASLSDSLDEGIRAEAKQLLGADLEVAGRRPLPPDLDQALAELDGAQRTDVREFVTIVAAPGQGGRPGRSQLVELKVVAGTYPFYGGLELEPERPLDQLLDGGTTVVAPDLLSRLGLRIGDVLRVGGEGFRIAGTVLSEPDRLSASFTLGPRVFLSAAALESTRLLRPGSRVLYRALIKLPEGTDPQGIEAAARHLKGALRSEHFRVETYTEAQPALRRGLARLERYLGLVALLSLLVGGVGVAQAIRAWLASRLDAIAILKCLGLRPREILTLYGGQAVALGIMGSLLGAMAGVAAQWLLPPLLTDLIPPRLIRPWQPAALLRGVGLGVCVAFLFSLPPLAAVLRVPPSRVLRRDAEPLPEARWVPWATALTIVAGIALMATIQAGSPQLGTQFTAGVLGTGAALTVAALAVTRGAGRARRDFGRVWLRHGLAALARPGATTLGAMVALGLGLLVILAMSLVERHLDDQLAAELPQDAPSTFLIDIQPDQWSAVEQALRRQGATQVESVPVIMARLTSVDGRGIRELSREAGDRERRWALTREQRLTYLEELPADNRIVDGALWSDPEKPEVSVEEEFAGELGARVGSTLGFDIQGVPFELAVTSIRTVDWESFGINFFLVVEPGSLEGVPHFRLATARVPEDREQQTQDLLAQRFPNVTVVQVRDILEKLVRLLQRLGWGVRFLGGFTVVAGLAILVGAIAAGSVRRGREVALLKTLGMTRRDVVGAFATEYALIGLVAGTIGSVGGGLLAWLVLTRGMEIAWVLYPAAFATALACSVIIAVLGGIAASLGALRKRPVEALREE